jgi:hypothetical protein
MGITKPDGLKIGTKIWIVPVFVTIIVTNPGRLLVIMEV